MTKTSKHLSLHEATDKIMAILDAEQGDRSTHVDSTTSKRGLGRGVGAWLAERLGIPPKLAVAGGENGYAAMLALQHARDAGESGVRQQHLAQAQRHIAKLDPGRHGPLLEHLQGCVVALGGRGGDRAVAHVIGGETPAFSDGVNWRRYADRNVVS